MLWCYARLLAVFLLKDLRGQGFPRAFSGKALCYAAGGRAAARAVARPRSTNAGRACKCFHLTTQGCVYRILPVDRHGEGGDNLIVLVLLEYGCALFLWETKRNTAVKLILMLAV